MSETPPSSGPLRGDIRMLFRQESADARLSLDVDHSRLSLMSVPTPSALMTSRTAIYVMEDSDMDDDDSVDDVVLGPPPPPRMLRHGSSTRLPRAQSQSTLTSSSPSRTGNLIHSGWLVKQGNIWKSWKKRFFVLLMKSNPVTGEPFSCLQYYKSHRFGRLKGEIALDDASTSVRFLDIRKSKRPHCFELVKGFNVLVCQAKDDEECNRWVVHLQDVIAANQPLSTPSQNHAPLRLSSGLLLDDDPDAKVAIELRKILEQGDAKNPEASKCMAFVKHFDARSSLAFSALRDFIASMRSTVIHKYAHGLVALVLDHFESEADALESVHHCIHRHVEEVVFLPLHDGLYSHLRRSVKTEHEAALNKKLRWLQGKDQAFYDIPQHQLSTTEWREASRILGQVATYSLPSDKYHALVESVVEIQASYQDDHPAPEFMYQAATSADGSGFNSLVPGIANRLDTDDLIPIFTFVLVNSGLENLLLLKQLLHEMHTESRFTHVHSASAMAILVAAIDFVQNVTIPAVLEDIFKEQVAFSMDGDWRMGLGFEPESTYRCGAMVKNITAHGQAAFGGLVSKGHVLVSLNGTNVVLWPFNDVVGLLNASAPPFHMAFISNPNYVKILGTNKSLWNVALMQACQRGAVGSVQMLLANGAEVNYVSDDDTTPLHIAVSCLHVNVVSYLLQHGAKTKVLSPHGRGPLHLLGAPCALIDGPSQEVSVKVASMSPDKVRQIILKLVRHGAAIDEVDHFGFTPLMLLAHKGCLEGVDTLVEVGKQLNINSRNWQRGCCALACAAQEGQTEVTTALLDYGAETELRSLRGETPLHFAASIASLTTCGVLLSEGKADVNARSNDGWTPLMMAVARGQLITRGYVQKDTAAVLDTVRLLLSERANVRDVCNMYRQPIHYAAIYGGSDVYHFLKSYHDVDIYAPDITGKTAAMYFEVASQTAVTAPTAIVPGRLERGSLLLSLQGSLLEPKPTFLGGASPDKTDSSKRDELSRSPPTSTALVVVGDAATDLIVETTVDGKEELQAGTVSAILSHLVQYDVFHATDMESFLWAGTHFTDYTAILRFLETFVADAPDANVSFARRVVLYTLDIWVNHLQSQMPSTWPLCHAISNVVIALLPAIVQNDPLVLQWLTYRQIALFVKACKNEDPTLATTAPCDRDYSALATYFETTTATLAFLDAPNGALKTTTPSAEHLAEKMRERLAIAGVLPETGANRDSKVLVVAPTSKRRFSVLDRVARLWQLDIDPGLVASQISLLQHWFFQKIPISELLCAKRSAATTPAYDKLRLLHNHCSLWVVNQILAREDVVDRAAILSYYIKVAGKCLSPLRNYDGFMAIMNALNDSSVFRLKKTWGRLPPAVRTLWQELKKWTEKGARPLHKLIKEVAVPSIPYLGLIIQQYVVAQEYPDHVQNNLINFKKIRLTANVVRLVVPCQKTPYIFSPDKRLLDNLSAPLQLATKDICFTRSLEVEPRIADVENP